MQVLWDYIYLQIWSIHLFVAGLRFLESDASKIEVVGLVLLWMNWLLSVPW